MPKLKPCQLVNEDKERKMCCEISSRITDVVFLIISEWMAATPLVEWLPTIDRWAMLIFFSPPSSTIDMRRIRSISPGQRFDTSYHSQHNREWKSRDQFRTKHSRWSFTTWYLTTSKSAASVSPYHSCPVALWSLSALEHLQGPHHQGISDVCPECGVAPHSVEHLFNCQSHPMQLTVQDLLDNLAADFFNLDNWR